MLERLHEDLDGQVWDWRKLGKLILVEAEKRWVETDGGVLGSEP